MLRVRPRVSVCASLNLVQPAFLQQMRRLSADSDIRIESVTRVRNADGPAVGTNRARSTNFLYHVSQKLS